MVKLKQSQSGNVSQALYLAIHLPCSMSKKLGACMNSGLLLVLKCKLIKVKRLWLKENLGNEICLSRAQNFC